MLGWRSTGRETPGELPGGASGGARIPPDVRTRLRDAAMGGGDDAGPLAPHGLRVLAAIGWRVLVLVAVLYVLGVVVDYLAAVVVPVAIALLLAAVLGPAVSYLVDRRMPRGPATALVLTGGLAGLGGALTFVVLTVINGLPDLQSQLAASIDAVATWLATGPLHLSAAQLGGVRDTLLAALNADPAALTAGALSTAATLGRAFTQILLVLFTLIFFLHGGAQIWRFLLYGAPAAVRSRIDVAGRRGLAALVSYTRATVVVAVVDATCIGIGLAVLRVPLAVPLAALVFLGAFIPIIGAVLAGGVAVLIALVANGPITAVIVLGVVIGVVQLEGHILQPLLLGRAVKLHPLAVVLVIAAGLLVAGIPGALLSVPLLAVLNAGIRSLLSDADEQVDPADVHTSQPDAPVPGPGEVEGGGRIDGPPGTAGPRSIGPLPGVE